MHSGLSHDLRDVHVLGELLLRFLFGLRLSSFLTFFGLLWSSFFYRFVLFENVETKTLLLSENLVNHKGVPVRRVQEMDHLLSLRIFMGSVVISILNLLLWDHLLTNVDGG